MTRNWPGTYSSVVAFDLEGSGVTRWVLPLADGTGWERRELTGGDIVDTLRNWLPTDLHTGPLVTSASPTLFYLSKSSLNIWTDERYSGSVGNTGDAWIRAFPNPFNGAVTLTWPASVAPASLRILNILGQTIYFREFQGQQIANSFEWDASTADGKALASGMYFAQLQARQGIRTVKLVLLR
ncbi:MAG: T9SS type A sorting domain-containing protein [candidate division Zixibacteria bacterium]|nr:T9SS type A sorting domain-containing protein [candidate division Zixibacteria bacterium]